MKKSERLAILRSNAKGIERDGKLYLLLLQDPVTGRTEPCPFCGKRHIHGKTPGHRSQHCPPQFWGVSVQNDRGQTFSCNDGYYIILKLTWREKLGRINNDMARANVEPGA